MTKVITIFNQKRRQQDDKGRIIATLEDYATLHPLVTQMYEETVTGVTAGIRAVVADEAHHCTRIVRRRKYIVGATARKLLGLWYLRCKSGLGLLAVSFHCEMIQLRSTRVFTPHGSRPRRVTINSESN